MDMARRIRFIPEGGSVVEVTSRTHEGRDLILFEPAIRALVLGVMGRAQKRYGMTIYGVRFLSNHYHLLLRAEDAHQLAGFMRYLNGQLARKLNRHLGRTDALWGRRYACVLVSDEPAAQVERYLYLLRQGVKEGLVACPLEWPGVTDVRALLGREALSGMWVDETALGQARRRGVEVTIKDFSSEERVTLTVLAAWVGLSEESRKQHLEELVQLVRAEARRREEETGRMPRGAEKLKASDKPRGKPKSRGHLPLVHAASRAARKRYWWAYRAFEAAFRRAAEALKQGIAGIPFPPGSFPPRAPFVPVRPAPA